MQRIVVFSLGLGLAAMASAAGWNCQPTNKDDPWQCQPSQKVLHHNADLPFTQWTPSTDPKYLCGGFYQEPSYPQIPNTPLNEFPVTLTAEQSSLAAHGPATFIGNVSIQQGNRSIHADKALVERDPATGRLRAISTEGHFVLTEPGLQVEGSTANTNFSTDKTLVNNATYIIPLYHSHGKADSLSLDGQYHLTLKNAQYSTCSPTNPDWVISAHKIYLDPAAGRGHASDIRLKLKNTPVLYLPYLNFPIDRRRQSGFLYPSFGNLSQSGSTLEIPYYWNLAPNYDATLTPKWISLRGLQGQIFGRYLTPHEVGHFRVSVLPHDKRYKQFKDHKQIAFAQDNLNNDDPRVLALNKGDNRSAISWQHDGHWTEHWQSKINYNWVSDDNYFIDLSNNIQSSSTSLLPQNAQIDYHSRHFHSALKIQEYQTLHPYLGPVQQDVYRKKPEWTSHLLTPIQYTPFYLDMNTDVAHFSHQRDTVTQESFTQGQRLALNPAIQYPIYKPYGSLVSRAQLYLSHYYLQRGTTDKQLGRPENVSRILGGADIDATLQLERRFQYHNQTWRQTLEPRLFYLYVPYENQNNIPNFDSGIIDFSYEQLFRTNRFIGLDRIGDANQLTAALTTRMVNPAQQEVLRLSVGEMIYLKKPKVSLCDPLKINGCLARENPSASNRTSDIAALARYRITQEWFLNSTLEWNQHEKTTDKSGIGIEYRGRQNRLINLGYQYIRQDLAETSLAPGTPSQHLKQTDISFAWPIRDRWRTLARWHHDWLDNQPIDTLAGVEYNTCCVAFQLTGSRYLRSAENWAESKYAKALFFKIMLKGLSNVQLSPESRNLSQEIPGFKSFVNTGFISGYDTIGP